MPASTPSSCAFVWAAGHVGRGARVVRARVLRGGIASTVHDLTVERRGRRSHLVLRRYLGGGRYARTAVRNEAEVLSALAPAGASAPRLVAADPDGIDAGCPALAMTRLPGRVCLTPPDPDRWVAEIAAQLCRIHQLPSMGIAFAPWMDPASLRVPAWSRRKRAWAEAIDVYRAGIPVGDTTFMHGDFQHFNILWSRGRLSGVVDWVGGSNGPPEVDVGHCRLNLAVLFSTERAERFRLAYEAGSGRALDPRWDVAALLAYIAHERWQNFIPMQVAGRAPVDLDGMDGRVEELLVGTLRRM
jgi:aminoglycoside phosphotransferase (APT) family kinase protein